MSYKEQREEVKRINQLRDMTGMSSKDYDKAIDRIYYSPPSKDRDTYHPSEIIAMAEAEKEYDRNNKPKGDYIPQSEFEKYRRLAESSLTSQAYSKYGLSVKSLGIKKFGISYKDNNSGLGHKNIIHLANEYRVNPAWIIGQLAKLGIHSEESVFYEFVSSDFKTVVKAINSIQNILEEIDKEREEKELAKIKEEENDKNLLKVDDIEIRITEVNGVKTINIIKSDNCNIKIKDEYVFVNTKEELGIIPIQVREQIKNCADNIKLKGDEVTFNIKRDKSKYECVTQSVVDKENKAYLNIFNYLMINKGYDNNLKYIISSKDKKRINSLTKQASDRGFDFYNNSISGFKNADYYCLSIPIKEFNMDKVKEFLGLWEEFNEQTENKLT